MHFYLEKKSKLNTALVTRMKDEKVFLRIIFSLLLSFFNCIAICTKKYNGGVAMTEQNPALVMTETETLLH